eukprot:TRINITY_DN66501_c0_g1_i1.p1 TRINITY_DN66501_c0_g1~~TRINITY_DN66501_c0_g1_i1.p1  ORF type:complete len:441 (+),score=141.98 TRINITY_DN66501_c0_g1_i1:91-1323(+)
MGWGFLSSAADLPLDMADSLMKTVTLRHPRTGNWCHVVGVSHLSARSEEEVREVVRYTQPRAVMVELCRERLDTILHNKGAPMILPEPSLEALQHMWRQLATPQFWLLTLSRLRLQCFLESVEGDEMLAACDEAHKTAIANRYRCSISPIDLPYEATLARVLTTAWFDIGPIALAKEIYLTAAVSDKSYPKMAAMQTAMDDLDKHTKEILQAEGPPSAEVREKARALAHGMANLGWDWQALFDEVESSEVMRKLVRAVIDDRDTFLAGMIRHELGTVRQKGGGYGTVAVLGAAHVDGVTQKYGTATWKDVEAAAQFPTERLQKMTLQLLGLSMVFPTAAFATGYALKRRGGNAQRYFRYASRAWLTGSCCVSAYTTYRAYSAYETTRKLQYRMYGLEGTAPAGSSADGAP